MEEKEKRKMYATDVKRHLDEIEFMRNTVDENELSLETLFSLSYAIGKAWLIYRTIFKIKEKMRIEKFKENNNGVSSVLGTLFMIVITASLMSTAYIISTETNYTQMQISRDTTSSLINMSDANVNMIQRFTDYVNNLSFNNTEIHHYTDRYGKTIYPPEITYDYNETEEAWQIEITGGSGLQLHQLKMDLKGNMTILPPPK